MAEFPKNIKREHFENLVVVAAADGYMDEDEKDFLADKAEEFGLDASTVAQIISNPQSLSFHVPESIDEKEEQLSDVVFMAMIDGEIHEKEYSLCLNFAKRLGMTAKDVDEIIALAKKLIK